MTVLELPRKHGLTHDVRIRPLVDAKPLRTRERLPNFMIIGAAKSATTSMHMILRNHPRVWMSTPKEPTFFSNPEVNERGMGWYSKLFEDAGEDQICGEASTTYMRYPFKESPNNRDPWSDIAQLDQDMQFIYMVRNPVDRAYSHYKHHMRRGCKLTFEQALESNSVYVDTSRYAMQLEHFKSAMPDAPLLILEFEKFKRDAESVTSEVFDFLGIENHVLDDAADNHANTGQEFYISSMVRRIPFFSQFRSLVPDSAWSFMRSTIRSSVAVNRFVNRRTSTPPMLPATRSRLLEMFEPDIVAVERLLGRSLAHWRI